MDELQQLLDRLKSAQRDLLYAVARTGAMPSGATLRKIGDLEAGIAATEALLAEEKRQP